MNQTTAPSSRMRWLLITIAMAAALGLVLAWTIVRTAPVRRALRVYTALLGVANRQDVDAARRLCSTRYLQTHELTAADEGGLVGLPRNVHPNFQTWRDGPNVLVCPTNRVGPVYQFVFERGDWRFDGPVGILRGRGRLVRLPDNPESESVPTP
jgi:hypothetical protein